MGKENIETEVRNISAEEFARVLKNSPDKITVLDLREPDEVLVHPIEGAINIPFSQIGSRLKEIDSDKPVYVICRTGDFSEEITEILTDRDYEAYNIEGGYDSYRKLLANEGKRDNTNTGYSGSDSSYEEEKLMEPESKASSEPLYIDARNLRCPGPIVKVADTLRELPEGTAVRVEATEDAFASDIAVWCERTGNRLDKLTVENGIIEAVIVKSGNKQVTPDKKADSVPDGTIVTESGNDKTFIVFSGDLDKTIASFILANGAAALGRNVTMFFTFWGLNILRRPKKVRVKKTFIETMFGIMLPRGSKKLGLSRMNMLGAGPKMIRAIMKSKGISSLEQLIEDARAHGVRLVACQMSMDIMGIHKEELIDGVELGGVATFLGSGEKSDISLFI